MVRAGTIDSSQQYRQQARKLRGRYVNQPVQLYRTLRQLSDRHDATAAESRVVHRHPASDESQDKVNAFGRLVASHLVGKVLPYSRRMELLNIAEKLGIGRFHANLVIAAVQHEFAEMIPTQNVARYRWRWPAAIFSVIAIQALVLLAAWAVFLR
jgi:hypothetical protein